MPAYGFSSEAHFPTNEAFVRHLADDSLARFVALGGNAELASRLEHVIDEAFDAVVPYAHGPAFAHNDLHPNNVLATETGDGKLVLSGIIDFGSAGAADPLFDLAKCLFSSEHDAPGSARHILDGYGPLDHPAPDKALTFYALLHRIIMWWWLRQAGTIASPDEPSDLIDDLKRMAAL